LEHTGAVILSHSMAVMSLKFFPLTTQSQVFPERYVYVPQRDVSCHAISMKSFHLIRIILCYSILLWNRTG